MGIRYDRTEWENEKTPVNQDNMNNIESGIVNATDAINKLLDGILPAARAIADEDGNNLKMTLINKADLVGGKVPANQLPSYVSDIVEVETYEDLPNPGNPETIYVVKNPVETTYRWSGSDYFPITEQNQYYSIKIDSNNIQTVGDLVDYVNLVNESGLHCFFDFSDFLDNAYICTVYIRNNEEWTHCLIYDLINGRTISDYKPIDREESISDYVYRIQGSIVTSIFITETNVCEIFSILWDIDTANYDTIYLNFNYFNNNPDENDYSLCKIFYRENPDTGNEEIKLKVISSFKETDWLSYDSTTEIYEIIESLHDIGDTSDTNLVTNLEVNEPVPEDNGLYKVTESGTNYENDVLPNSESYILVNEEDMSGFVTTKEPLNTGSILITNLKLVENVSVTKPGYNYAYLKINTSLSDEQVTDILDTLDDEVEFLLYGGGDYRIIFTNSEIRLIGDEGYDIATIFTSREGWLEDADIILIRNDFTGSCFKVNYASEDNLNKLVPLIEASYYIKINESISNIFTRHIDYNDKFVANDKYIKTKLSYERGRIIEPNTYTNFFFNTNLSKEEVTSFLTNIFSSIFYSNPFEDHTEDIIQNHDPEEYESRVIQIQYTVFEGFKIINHCISSQGTPEDYVIFTQKDGWSTNRELYRGFYGDRCTYGFYKFALGSDKNSILANIISNTQFICKCSLINVDENEILTKIDEINEEGNYILKAEKTPSRYGKYNFLNKPYLNTNLDTTTVRSILESNFRYLDYQNHDVELIRGQEGSLRLYVNSRHQLYYRIYIKYNDSSYADDVWMSTGWDSEANEKLLALGSPFVATSGSISVTNNILLGDLIVSKNWSKQENVSKTTFYLKTTTEYNPRLLSDETCVHIYKDYECTQCISDQDKFVIDINAEGISSVERNKILKSVEFINLDYTSSSQPYNDFAYFIGANNLIVKNVYLHSSRFEGFKIVFKDLLNNTEIEAQSIDVEESFS